MKTKKTVSIGGARMPDGLGIVEEITLRDTSSYHAQLPRSSTRQWS